MNTYRPVQVSLHLWAVEWLVDGISQGYTLGRYQDRAEACYVVYEFARMEALEAPSRPDTA
jgi:hypothetical protein